MLPYTQTANSSESSLYVCVCVLTTLRQKFWLLYCPSLYTFVSSFEIYLKFKDALFFVNRLVPESPRWLLIRQDRETFRRIVLKACKKNGISTDYAQSEVDKLLLRGEELKTSSASTVVDLFKTPRLRKHTLILFYNW